VNSHSYWCATDLYCSMVGSLADPMTLDYPINPLLRKMDSTLLHRSLTSIFDSYHAPDQDLLTEIVQNSVDALEERAFEDKKFNPWLKLEIDTKKNSIEIVDNGIGVPYEILRGLGTPHNTTKHVGRRRGHKGVGLTFAAWSTTRFQFATKRTEWKNPEAGRLEGAAPWLDSGQGDCPVIQADKPYSKSLPDDVSGTAFKFTFAPESKVLTLVRRLRAPGIVTFLRTRTALGFLNLPEISLQTSDWVSKTKVEIWVDGDRLEFGQVGYIFPHNLVDPKHALDLTQLSKVKPEIARRMQGKKKFIYRSLTNQDVIALLEGAEEAGELKEFAKKQAVTAYVCFADQKATFELLNSEFYKEAPGPGRKTSVVGPGIQLATATMPVGKPLDVDLRYGTGNKNRIFAVVQFDEIKPDFGRKTFHSAVDNVAQAIISRVAKELVENRLYLVPHETPHGETPTEQEQELGALKALASERSALGLKGLGLVTEPRYEQEVLALFVGLVSTNRLPGYELLACPGSSRKYDSIVNFSITKEENSRVNKEIRVGPEMFPAKTGQVAFKDQILEFKHAASELLFDFDGGIKRPKDIFMLVCWELGNADAFEQAGINCVRLTDHNEPAEIVGQTHLLEYNANRIHVLVLKDVITTLAAAQLQPQSAR
jgi:hypothetical protein